MWTVLVTMERVLNKESKDLVWSEAWLWVNVLGDTYFFNCFFNCKT